ncbi:MAG: phospholipase D-like domain-containing anti-phage protein [Bacillota bacterium]
MIQRFSSRREKLDHSFLKERLSGARAYDRIAGYFSSSVLEVSGEALETVSGLVRVICNSDLHIRDVETARAAQYAMRQEWCGSEPEKLGPAAKTRFARLFEFLRSGKLRVRVLPRDRFGLVHGKAGVITLVDGRKTAFIGSANETHDAWKLNYEILWEDDSSEAVQWVQEEFDALWDNPFAVPLADFVVEDIGRLARRTVVPKVDDWQSEADPAATVIEAPVFRREYGMWEHQKHFVKMAFDAHRGPHGARLILADMVGLGKTLQLALSAQLMALYGHKPILVLVPKTLLWQWQDEMRSLLDMPSAVWTGKHWVDENGIEHPAAGPDGIRKCPRRVGIVSQGLITRESEITEHLKKLSYECVIVDEVHRARRKNLGSGREDEKPEPNNLLAFLYEIAPRTKSLLLATATPVQINPVEAWDFLDVLAKGNDAVLGSEFSRWRHAGEALDVIMGKRALSDNDSEREIWAWIRNPFPPRSEGRDFELLRRLLRMTDDQTVIPGDIWFEMGEPERDRIRRLSRHFMQNHNPFIRHIVRRTRGYLENTIDPETNEPYLKPIKVELFGESDSEAVGLPPYLQDAYNLAEAFCQLLSDRMRAAGFLKTLLLRRIGSTIYAGKNTAEKLLGDGQDISEEDEDTEDDGNQSQLKNLTPAERGKLQDLVHALEANRERDPKYSVVLDCLLVRGWLDLGCIIFSQYYDSIWWLAQNLSRELPEQKIGIYAGAQRSGIMVGGGFSRVGRDELKKLVAYGEIKLLLGTDAASEGLNLQRLGTLINLDLPWNPTRLEQRKGRILRIGQIRDTVYIYNMRYRGSVEDRVHELLSERLEQIYNLFGQIPDVLEDVWINIALGRIEKARQTIDAVVQQHPFELKYHQLQKVPWESCATVLDAADRRRHLMQGW